MMNPSVNSSFVAVCLPLEFKQFSAPYRWALFCLAAIAANFGHSNSGLLLLVIFLALHIIKEKRWWLLLALPPIGASVWYVLGTKFLSSGGRLPMWKFFMHNWARNPLHWSGGTGMGTFGVFSLNLQHAFENSGGPISNGWWLWLHNDWLQMTFETGSIGLILAIAIYTAALVGLYRRGLIAELQSLLIFGAMMGSNFPLHLGVPCAFVAWILCLGLYNPHMAIHNKRLKH
jgi:O-antigen ligase